MEELPGKWDRAKLTQVFSNLLGNAIQHGAIDSPVIVTAEGDKSGVAVSVHNEGAPIPAEIISKLFDCLFQGTSEQRAAEDNSTSLGLGLYISKEIIAAHGGTIEVQSTADAGTTFIVHLPREPLVKS